MALRYSILWDSLWTDKKYILYVMNEIVLILSANSLSMIQLTEVSLYWFLLYQNIFINESGILGSPTIILSGHAHFFVFISVCFMKVGTPKFHLYIFIVTIFLNGSVVLSLLIWLEVTLTYLKSAMPIYFQLPFIWYIDLHTFTFNKYVSWSLLVINSCFFFFSQLASLNRLVG